MNEHYRNRIDRILAIDIGSSSTRSEVFDAALNPVDATFSQRTYTLDTGPDGKAELDPIELLKVVCTCIDTSSRQTSRIDAIGISCFWHSLMGLDNHGEPTTAVLMWADTRAAGAVSALMNEIDPLRHHQITGTRLHTSYPMAKLRWLRDDHPDIMSRTTRWVSFPEFLQERLTGVAGVSTSMASGTGIFDRQDLQWSTETLEHLGLTSEQFNQRNDEPVIIENPDRWPQLHNARWIPTIGDGAANNLGSHAIVPEHPALMVGTTGALRVVTQHPPAELPARLWQYRLDADNALLGGALSEGGGVIAWMMDHLNAGDHRAVEQEISQRGPDSHGLIVLPYLAGERSPNWHSDAVGTIHGLRFDTRPTDIIQATMESIGFSFAAILDDLAHLLEPPVEIIATGNALRLNRTWIQMIADISGYTLLLPRKTESSLRGAALHAMRQIGQEAVIPDLCSDSERFEPDQDRTSLYEAARERQTHLYKLLVERTY
jgi:gluconokinase